MSLDPFDLDPRSNTQADLDALFVVQKGAALKATMGLMMATDLLLAHLGGEGMSEDSFKLTIAFTRIQGDHIERYMRLPQNRKLPPEHRRLGSAIDRLLLQVCGVLDQAIYLYRLPEKLAVRRGMVEESERRRRERIEARRRRVAEAASAVTAAPVTPVPKREKRAPQPRCEKCRKRAQKVGTLCEPCARWVGR